MVWGAYNITCCISAFTYQNTILMLKLIKAANQVEMEG